MTRDVLCYSRTDEVSTTSPQCNVNTISAFSHYDDSSDRLKLAVIAGFSLLINIVYSNVSDKLRV